MNIAQRRDPRKSFEIFSFAEGVEKPEDLREGMKIPGIVTNVTNFGAFVDVGVDRPAYLFAEDVTTQEDEFFQLWLKDEDAANCLWPSSAAVNARSGWWHATQAT